MIFSAFSFLLPFKLQAASFSLLSVTSNTWEQTKSRCSNQQINIILNMPNAPLFSKSFEALFFHFKLCICGSQKPSEVLTFAYLVFWNPPLFFKKIYFFWRHTIQSPSLTSPVENYTFRLLSDTSITPGQIAYMSIFLYNNPSHPTACGYTKPSHLT